MKPNPKANDYEAARRAAWPHLSLRDRLSLLDPHSSRVEAVVADALCDASRRGLSVAEIVAGEHGTVSHTAVRAILRCYAASGVAEVAGLAPFLPLGRRRPRYRPTPCGRSYLAMPVVRYRAMNDGAAA